VADLGSRLLNCWLVGCLSTLPVENGPTSRLRSNNRRAGCDQWHSSFTDAPRSTEPGFAIRKALANAAQLSGLTG
jgi:hypothetical protein